MVVAVPIILHIHTHEHHDEHHEHEHGDETPEWVSALFASLRTVTENQQAILERIEQMSATNSDEFEAMRDQLQKASDDFDKFRSDVNARLDTIGTAGTLNTAQRAAFDEAKTLVAGLDSRITDADAALQASSTVSGAGGGTDTTGGGASGAVVFDSADPTPNGSPLADGTIRNTPGADPVNPMPGFDPTKPVTR